LHCTCFALMATQRAAGFATLTRSESCPAGKTASGLPASSLLGSTVVQVAPVLRCQERRRDATIGYRGFIPGLKAETVYGTSRGRANSIAHGIRPIAYQEPLPAKDWSAPLDATQSVRSKADVAEWTYHQHHTRWMGGELPVDYGPAIPGYAGHRNFRRQLQQPLRETLATGERHSLDILLPADRECQPFEAHRARIPGYTGHVRYRSLA